MNDAKGFFTFIVSISAALGGLGGILYGSGYLITRAHYHLLGLYAIAGASEEGYMNEGRKFFVDVGMQLGDVLLSLLLLAGVVLLPLLAVALIVMLIKRVGPLQARPWALEKLRAFEARRPGLLRALAYLILLVLLIFGSEDPQNFNDPLQVAGLLYALPAPGASAQSCAQLKRRDGSKDTVAAISCLIRHGHTAQLRAWFENALLFVFKAVVLLLLAWLVCARWRYNFLALAPFAVVALLYIVQLPMLYGVLQKPVSFPAVHVTSNNELLKDAAQPLYLLGKTEREFVLFDGARRAVLWVPLSEVKGAQIGESARLFGAAP